MQPLRFTALLFAMAAAPIGAQQCPDALPPTGHLGFRWLHCPNGGPCWLSTERDRWYDLANVPRVRLVDPDGPAAGLLRDGDMLVSVDGMLTTSLAGGRHLANLVPGRPVVLTVQRADGERQVTVIPRAQCGLMGLAVNSVADSAGFADLISGRALPRLPQPRISVATDAAVVRRSTPHLDLEMSGVMPLVQLDSLSGRVTLVFPASRVTIQPRSARSTP